MRDKRGSIVKEFDGFKIPLAQLNVESVSGAFKQFILLALAAQGADR